MLTCIIPPPSQHPLHPPAGALTLDQLIELLKKFQSSMVGREQQVFDCMIASLFDEYNFFIKYPDKELHITGGCTCNMQGGGCLLGD
jgi:hypothetical protein